MFHRTALLMSVVVSYSVQMYEKPDAKTAVIGDVDAEHAYIIETQDWVKITDVETKATGWARLSELKPALSQNSQWSYQWSSGKSGSKQRMHYKPFSADDISKHVKMTHKEHRRIMSQFESFWDMVDQEVDHVSEVKSSE